LRKLVNIERLARVPAILASLGAPAGAADVTDLSS
jgi:hypothetical protein